MAWTEGCMLHLQPILCHPGHEIVTATAELRDDTLLGQDGKGTIGSGSVMVTTLKISQRDCSAPDEASLRMVIGKGDGFLVLICSTHALWERPRDS